ncbi:helix-turn-helix domain-containing protein [Pseudorhodoferax sp. Leaf265]|uniref:helix-turn-helix domain-containing protein n=1 Tax=Pseudorhodoferax sp. Leaf265 TaxID=1736315 RepID=UPI0006F385CC|nr:helix-turn-helix transcriptional regulator [Pseudorhodoferax sp. Leaf265]KQP15573.1 hypothetical protein ASF45_28675 [Pseudorhodoferax sp. Leaf265]
MSEPNQVLTARMLLSANVAALRMKQRISQERLGELAGFHRTYISQLERGLSNVTVDNIEKLAAVLGVPVASLLEKPSGGEAPDK